MFHDDDSKLAALAKSQQKEKEKENQNQKVNLSEENQDLNVSKLVISAPLIGDISLSNQIMSFTPLSLSGIIDIFGDSIAQGAGVAATQRWTKLVCDAYGATENNLAIPGDEIIDMTIRIFGSTTAPVGSPAYLGHVNGRTSIIAVGINDIYLQPETAYDETKRTLESLALYCTLPSTQKLDVRNPAVTKSGAWFNTPAFNIGMYTMGNGASVTATVTGRYVVFASTILTGGSLSAHSNISVTLDGVTINSSLPRFSGKVINSYNNTNFINSLWLYDTESTNTTPHTITIAQAPQTGLGIFFTFVDWIGAFNQNQEQCSPVFICTPDTTDWAMTTQLYGGLFPSAIGSERAWHTIRQNQQQVVQKWNLLFGLPVYYVDMSSTNIYGQKIDDIIHPNVNGHKFLSNRFQSLLNNGTYNTLWV